MEKPLLAAGVVLLGLIGVAAAAACAWESGGAAVDVGEGADAPAPAGRCRLLPAVAVGGAHRRRVRGRVWLAGRVVYSARKSRTAFAGVGLGYTELRLRGYHAIK